jgi:hypothetical protein
MPTAFGFHPYKSNNVLRSGFPVCTVVTFTRAGDFKPVSFGVEIDGMRYRYNVTVKAFKEIHGQFTFDCEYVDLGRLKAVRLEFDTLTMLWTVG